MVKSFCFLFFFFFGFHFPHFVCRDKNRHIIHFYLFISWYYSDLSTSSKHHRSHRNRMAQRFNTEQFHFRYLAKAKYDIFITRRLLFDYVIHLIQRNVWSSSSLGDYKTKIVPLFHAWFGHVVYIVCVCIVVSAHLFRCYFDGVDVNAFVILQNYHNIRWINCPAFVA